MGLSTTPSIFINFHFTASKSSTPVNPKRSHLGLPFLTDIRIFLAFNNSSFGAICSFERVYFAAWPFFCNIYSEHETQ